MLRYWENLLDGLRRVGFDDLAFLVAHDDMTVAVGFQQFAAWKCIWWWPYDLRAMRYQICCMRRWLEALPASCLSVSSITGDLLASFALIKGEGGTDVRPIPFILINLHSFFLRCHLSLPALTVRQNQFWTDSPVCEGLRRPTSVRFGLEINEMIVEWEKGKTGDPRPRAWRSDLNNRCCPTKQVRDAFQGSFRRQLLSAADAQGLHEGNSVSRKRQEIDYTRRN